VAEVADLLTVYLREAAGASFDWRSRNCHVFAADWVLRATGADVGADFRGSCCSPRSAARAIRRAGFRDLAGCTEARMREAGFAEIDPAAVRLGDIGIVMTVGETATAQQTLAIRARNGWAVLAPKGLLIAKGRAERAWSIGR
jgi:hypothetical protein